MVKLYHAVVRNGLPLYVVPEDAEPWEEAKRRAAEWLEDIQLYFADEMMRLGYGPRTFDIAKDVRGELLFHQISSHMPKTAFHSGRDYRKNCIKAAQISGLQPGSDRIVCFHESCSIKDGKVFGDGSSYSKGYSFLGSLHLKLAKREWLGDKTNYEGMVFSWISSEPVKRGMLKQRGSTLGELSGAEYGIMAHELCHCFGPRNENDDLDNRWTNLMYYGCRRMRGPKLANERCRLSERSGAILNQSEFFTLRNLKDC
jgi:hypothetical protein